MNRPRRRAGMALALTLLLLIVTIPLLLGLLGTVTRSTRGASWSRAHAGVEDCTRAAVAEVLHALLGSLGEAESLADGGTPYTRTVDVPYTREFVADPAGFQVEAVRLSRPQHQGADEFASGLLQVDLELVGPRGPQQVTVLRVFTARRDHDDQLELEIWTQDLLFERGQG